MAVRVDHVEQPVAQDRFDRGIRVLAFLGLTGEDLAPLRTCLLDRQIEVVAERRHRLNLAGL